MLACLHLHNTKSALGGSGKTVQARLLFNALAPRFPHRAFISINPEDGEQQLQPHLVQALKSLGAPFFNEHLDTARLCTVLEEFLQRRPVLLVIDNIWTGQQLDMLLPTQLGSGSKVIITSRFGVLESSRRYKV